MKTQRLQKLKAAARRLLPWLVFFALLAGLAAVRGLTHAFTADYEIMNGDFQNYNPVRRLLAGQRPYADFTVYLGAGELYSVAAVLLAVGNSFGRSLFATNALTWFFFELLVFAAALAALGKAKRAAGCTLALCGGYFALVQGLPGIGKLPGAALAQSLLGYAAANGNSARMIRAAALPLAVILLWAACRRAYRQKGPGYFPVKAALLAPLLVGALVPWSNDMGAALYLALSLAYGLLLLRHFGRQLRAVALWVARYVGLSVGGLGVSVPAVSAGPPLAW
ncbi:MAG: hypothetical protein PHO10_10535, partial [Gemmiger sp.]|nr:hypothetical protein [Gemmiger sp.]